MSRAGGCGRALAVWTGQEQTHAAGFSQRGAVIRNLHVRRILRGLQVLQSFLPMGILLMVRVA